MVGRLFPHLLMLPSRLPAPTVLSPYWSSSCFTLSFQCRALLTYNSFACSSLAHAKLVVLAVLETKGWLCHNIFSLQGRLCNNFQRTADMKGELELKIHIFFFLKKERLCSGISDSCEQKDGFKVPSISRMEPNSYFSWEMFNHLSQVFPGKPQGYPGLR